MSAFGMSHLNGSKGYWLTLPTQNLDWRKIVINDPNSSGHKEKNSPSADEILWGRSGGSPIRGHMLSTMDTTRDTKQTPSVSAMENVSSASSSFVRFHRRDSFCILCLESVPEEACDDHIMTDKHKQLKVHLLHDMYPYSCVKCQFRFCKLQDLEHHYSKHNLEVLNVEFEPICCYLCKAPFNSDSDLQDHQTTSLKHAYWKDFSMELTTRHKLGNPAHAQDEPLAEALGSTGVAMKETSPKKVATESNECMAENSGMAVDEVPSKVEIPTDKNSDLALKSIVDKGEQNSALFPKDSHFFCRPCSAYFPKFDRMAHAKSEEHWKSYIQLKNSSKQLNFYCRPCSAYFPKSNMKDHVSSGEHWKCYYALAAKLHKESQKSEAAHSAPFETTAGVTSATNANKIGKFVVTEQVTIEAMDVFFSLESNYIHRVSSSEKYTCSKCKVQASSRRIILSHILGHKHMDSSWNSEQTLDALIAKIVKLAFLVPIMRERMNKVVSNYNPALIARCVGQMLDLINAHKNKGTPCNGSNLEHALYLADCMLDCADEDRQIPNFKPRRTENFLKTDVTSPSDLNLESETVKLSASNFAPSYFASGGLPICAAGDVKQKIQDYLSLEEKYITKVEGERYSCLKCSVKCSYNVMLRHVLTKGHMNSSWALKETPRELEEKLKQLKVLHTLVIQQKDAVLKVVMYNIEIGMKFIKSALFPLSTKAASFNQKYTKHPVTGSFKAEKAGTVPSNKILSEEHCTILKKEQGDCSYPSVKNAILLGDSASSSLQEQFHKACNGEISDFDMECGTCGVVFQIYNDDVDFSLDMHLQNDPQHFLATAVPVERDALRVAEMSKSDAPEIPPSTNNCNQLSVSQSNMTNVQSPAKRLKPNASQT